VDVADAGNDIALQVQMAVPTGAGRTPADGMGSLRTTSRGIVETDHATETGRRHKYPGVMELQRGVDVVTLVKFVGHGVALRVQTAVPTGAGRAPVVGSGSLRTTLGGIMRADVTPVCRKAKIVRRHQYADVAERLRRMVAERPRSLNDRLKTGRQLRISHTAKPLIQDKPLHNQVRHADVTVLR